MKKIFLLVVLVIISVGCCGVKERDYSNSKIIADLDQRTSICNNTPIKIRMTTLGSIDNDTNYRRIGTTDTAIYYYYNYQGTYNYSYTYKSNDYWRDVFGDNISAVGVGGDIYGLYAKYGGKEYTIYFEGFTLYTMGGLAMLNEGQYKKNGNKISYICLNGVKGSLEKTKGYSAGHRMIIYQIDVDLETMKVDLTMLAYKTWNDGKLIEEKYFY